MSICKRGSNEQLGITWQAVFTGRIWQKSQLFSLFSEEMLRPTAIFLRGLAKSVSNIQAVSNVGVTWPKTHRRCGWCRKLMNIEIKSQQ